MKYISLFSGIEASTVAAKTLNWEAVAFSEIADFPNAVLHYHYPNIPNLGDIKNINGKKYYEKVDLIVGGSPCQDFSVSGKRAGLFGNNSSLAWEYIRVLSEIRPKWFIWENVPGAMSTNKGNDFGQLLSEMEKLGYGLAWRILDAQYFGVPQRRRRIFLIGYFGDWRPPVAVLFESQSLSGNFTKSKRKQYTSFNSTNASITTLSKLDNSYPEIANPELFTKRNFIFDFMHNGSCRTYHNCCPTLLSRMGTGGNQVPVTFCAQSFSKIKQCTIGSTLKAKGGMQGGGSENYVVTPLSLRKLSPLECERLQGFPDNYTDIVYKGKQHSPLSKRYEAIGNSIAVPVLQWIFKRIEIISRDLRI